MNRMPKLVVSRTRTDLSAWQNSSLMSGELLDVVERTKAGRDVIVAGSASIVHALEEHDRVDEYRGHLCEVRTLRRVMQARSSQDPP
jgi:dihydrofolate reductase